MNAFAERAKSMCLKLPQILSFESSKRTRNEALH